MDALTLVKAFSVALAAGALSLLLSEWRFYRRSFRKVTEIFSAAPDMGRLLRRSVGSAILLVMSALMFAGRLPQKGVTEPAEALHLFYYWAAIMGLALLLGLIALADALSGVKKLGSAVSLEHARELSALSEQLRDAQIDPAQLELDIIEDQNLRPHQA